ncbi:TsaA-like domain-containing protein [Entamoeba marina]
MSNLTYYNFLLDSHNLPHDVNDMTPSQVDQCHKLTLQYVKDILHISVDNLPSEQKESLKVLRNLITGELLTYRPIGYVHSIFTERSGVPRQAAHASHTACYIEFLPWISPELAIRDLALYSHAQILFSFHLNKDATFKPLVLPPRKSGEPTSVLSTRSPVRPNNIGLSSCPIAKVEGNKLYLNGIDFIDGTPILDVKPYLAVDSINPNSLRTPEWFSNSTQMKNLEVKFDKVALDSINSLVSGLTFYHTADEFIQVITELLQLDVRNMQQKENNVTEGFKIVVEGISISFNFVGSSVEVKNAERITD